MFVDSDDGDGIQPPPPTPTPPGDGTAGSGDEPDKANVGNGEKLRSGRRVIETAMLIFVALVVGFFLGLAFVTSGLRTGWWAPWLWWFRLIAVVITVMYMAWKASGRLLVRREMRSRVDKKLGAPERKAELDKVKPTIGQALAPLLVPIFLIALPLVGPSWAPSAGGNPVQGTNQVQVDPNQLCPSGNIRACEGVYQLWINHNKAWAEYAAKCNEQNLASNKDFCKKQLDANSLASVQDAKDQQIILDALKRKPNQK